MAMTLCLLFVRENGTSDVLPKNGCRLGSVLYAIDRGYVPSISTCPTPKNSKRILVEEEENLEDGTVLLFGTLWRILNSTRGTISLFLRALLIQMIVARWCSMALMS